MRTVKFRDILWGVATRMGMDPETALNNNDARAITEYINLAYGIAWKMYPWPETTLVETRTPVDQIIPLAASGTTTIGEVFSISLRDPEKSANPGAIDYRLSQRGIIVPEDYATTELYLHYRAMPPVFNSTPWASGNYAVDDVVYYQTTGHTYKCIAAATTQVPTDTSKWAVLPVLAILAEAVKAGAYAATLAEEGQHSTAALAGAAMNELLAVEMDALENQTIHNPSLRVLTRVPPC